MAYRRFVLEDSKSSKFWQVQTRKTSTIVQYGRIGTDGRRLEKEHASSAAAKAELEKLIVQKLKKGYRELPAGQTAGKKIATRKNSKSSRGRTAKVQLAAVSVDSVDALILNDSLDIVGLVGPGSGGAGVWSKGVRDYNFVATFDAWKAIGGPLVTEPLQIQSSNVSERRLNNLMKQFDAFKQLKVRIRIRNVGRPKRKIGEIVKLLGSSRDPDLRKHIAELKRPVIIRDPFLGKVEYQRKYNWFAVKKRWGTRKVRLTLDASRNDDRLKQLLVAARELWSSQQEWAQKIKKYAARKMLKGKNENWLGDSEKPLTTETFIGRMKLDTISLGIDRNKVSFQFWYDDGDLFWGHSIVVGGNLMKGPTYADLQG